VVRVSSLRRELQEGQKLFEEAVSAALKAVVAVIGFGLPPLGRSAASHELRVIRYEPTVWLVEGDVIPLYGILADDGALTAIGGGVVRVRLSGSGWRQLLMESGAFNAENPAFAPGCSAATIINHVAVRLHVVREDMCEVYVPSSFSSGLMHFWVDVVNSFVD
jgi:heterotetrameric sarcosine oxidase gamma subunit